VSEDESNASFLAKKTLAQAKAGRVSPISIGEERGRAGAQIPRWGI